MTESSSKPATADLVDRLAKYRARLEREGRRAGVKALDRTIEELRQTSRTA